MNNKCICGCDDEEKIIVRDRFTEELDELCKYFDHRKLTGMEVKLLCFGMITNVDISILLSKGDIGINIVQDLKKAMEDIKNERRK